MTDNVVKLPIIPRRYPPYANGLSDVRKTRESIANVQEITTQFCTDTWRNEKFGNALVWVERALANPLGGKEWVLEALDRLKQYVERK